MSDHFDRNIRIFSRLAAVVFALAAAISASCANAQRMTVTPDHADTVYQPGQTVHWTIRWNGADAPSAVEYVLKRGGMTEAGKGSLTLKDGAAELDSKFDGPGTLLLDVKATGPDSKPVRALGGVVASPEKITPSAPRPKDFDAFWASKLKELAAIPADPQLQEAPVDKAGVSYWKITMNNIRGTHIRGQVARPTGTGKLPALLIVQWAGVYPLQRGWVTDRAKDGWLALNIEAHDLPIDEPESFYRDQSAGPLNNYPAIGNEDRDTSYFLRMYLSCYRAAEYLTHRPDWDGKTLVVMGGSQGGLQALMTAGFHPKITACLAEVPAGCDMLGPEVGRSPGWPMWYWQTKGKDENKVRSIREASRYYDVVNFASRIKCPVLIGAGMIDETCPPAGILAGANQIKSPKEVVLMPRAPHQDENHSHAPYAERCWSAWLPALRFGQRPPVQPTYNVARR
jgi:cephalosporin-C deacetylase